MARETVAPTSSQRAPFRYLTLAAARALECNGCGDCCDSRRTEDWTWAALPEDGYRSLTGGRPLIIPIELVDGDWRDRDQRPEDSAEFSGTRFRCAALQAHSDGTASCLRHDQPRPEQCGRFPVGGSAIEAELLEQHEVRLQTGSLPRCTWHNVVVVDADAPRLLGDE